MSIMDELKKLTRPYDDDGTMVDDELDDMDTGLDDAAFTCSAAAPRASRLLSRSPRLSRFRARLPTPLPWAA